MPKLIFKLRETINFFGGGEGWGWGGWITCECCSNGCNFDLKTKQKLCM
jgi:hypothetical protein